MVATSAGEEKPEMGAAVHEEQSLHQKDLVLQVPCQVLNPKAESLCHEVAYLQRQVQEQNLLPEKAILLWALDSEQYHNPVQTVLVEELCREHPLVGLVLKQVWKVANHSLMQGSIDWDFQRGPMIQTFVEENWEEEPQGVVAGEVHVLDW
jgi:hypothetical protein